MRAETGRHSAWVPVLIVTSLSSSTGMGSSGMRFRPWRSNAMSVP